MIKSSTKVHVRAETTQTETIIFVSGEIDEEAEFVPLESQPKVLVLDLNDVKMINSCGLRSWVMWIATISAKTQLILRRCPKIIVDQINILDNFVPRGSVVESFYVPYYCESCGHEDMVLVNRGKEFHEALENNEFKNNIPSERPCSHCDTVMDLAIFPDKYFRFFNCKKAS